MESLKEVFESRITASRKKMRSGIGSYAYLGGSGITARACEMNDAHSKSISTEDTSPPRRSEELGETPRKTNRVCAEEREQM